MAKQFEVLRSVAEGSPAFSRRDAFVCLGGLVDKVSPLGWGGLRCFANRVNMWSTGWARRGA